MSHFTVGVIVRDPSELESVLARYNEQDEEYMEREVEWNKQDYIDYYRNEHPDTCLTDDAIWEAAQADYGPNACDDEHIYTFYNPDARWDWWSIGGRWRYTLKVLKNAEHIKDEDMFIGKPRKQKGKYRWCDGAKIKDIRWADMNRPTREQIQAAGRFWDVVVDGVTPREGEDYRFCYRKEYYINRYGTKENYIMKEHTFYTHDLLDGPNDIWYSMGDMGWFGLDAATRDSFEDYLQEFYEIIQRPEYQDYWFIVVDCHI